MVQQPTAPNVTVLVVSKYTAPATPASKRMHSVTTAQRTPPAAPRHRFRLHESHGAVVLQNNRGQGFGVYFSVRVPVYQCERLCVFGILALDRLRLQIFGVIVFHVSVPFYPFFGS